MSPDLESREQRPRSTPRTGKWLLPGAAGVVLVGGLVALLVALNVGGIRGSGLQQPVSGAPAAPAKPTPAKPNVPLEPDARRVAGRFILSAVVRRNLADSYAITAPALRQGLTLQQWETGNIPVVPYPTADLKPVRLSVTRSTKNAASIRVFLDPRVATAGIKAQIFIMQLEKTGGSWLVTAWVPYNAIAIPLTQT